MSMNTEVRTSPQKARKLRASTLVLRDAISAVTDEYDRMSVRQLYYQLVSRGVVEKTERAYKRVQDHSAQMREDGSLDFSKIVDGSRSRMRVYAHGSLQEALENAAVIYRRNHWIDQPGQIEVWCEKDALTGVIQPVCERYGVTYCAARGFNSLTIMFESAQELREIDKPVRIIYLGDHDASGQSMSTILKKQLLKRGAVVTVERIALNPDQVAAYNLPTRPGKQTDSRHKGFVAQFGSDASVELDALPPNVITRLVEEAILANIDRDSWNRVELVERLEQDTLATMTLVDWRTVTRETLYGLIDDAEEDGNEENDERGE